MNYFCNNNEMEGTFPTEAGWYWYKKYKSWDSTHWIIVELTENTHKHIGREGVLQDGWGTKMYQGEWFGPIPLPTIDNAAKHLPIVIKAFKEHRKAIQKCVDLIYNKGDTKARQQEADSANQKLLKAIDDASKIEL